jgi:hypothetical protein
MKSTTCKGSNNLYLEEYLSESAARFEAERIKKEYDRDLSPYLCRTCGYWHLAPVSKTRVCMFCTDSGLFQKDIYPTRNDALVVAQKISKEKRIQLYPYKCKYSNGWHLTKNRPR